MSHFRNECKHGTTISQCRCPGPKTVNVIDPCPFPEHAAPAAEAPCPVAVHLSDGSQIACVLRRGHDHGHLYDAGVFQ